MKEFSRESVNLYDSARRPNKKLIEHQVLTNPYETLEFEREK